MADCVIKLFIRSKLLIIYTFPSPVDPVAFSEALAYFAPYNANCFARQYIRLSWTIGDFVATTTAAVFRFALILRNFINCRK